MIVVEIIASRTCSSCGQIVEINLQKVENLSQKTLPWVVFYNDLLKLPKLECCQKAQFPTHIQIKEDVSKNDSLFYGNNKFKVGSEDVPVVIDELNSFAVTRGFKEQLEIEQQLQKQNKLWERQKEAFFKKTYTYFSAHFEQIIDEMDHQELLDILRTFEDDYLSTRPSKQRRFVYKGKNERKLITKWIKRELKSLAKDETEEIKKYLFFLIVEYFVLLKLIPQIHYLKWNVQKFEKMIGESLLTYLLVTFPLTSYFSFLKDEAILRLTNKGHFQKELRQLLEKTQKQLGTVSSNNEKMQQTIESHRESMADLEAKNERLRIENSRLEERLNETGDILLLARQTQKIKELKGIINELQEEIKSLRLEGAQELNGVKEVVGEKIETFASLENVEMVKDFSKLAGKTVAIFGDIQGYTNENDKYPCKILSAESMKNPDAVAILNESEILVVLIQHISHSCMWSIKGFATQKDIPVIYSRHTNLQIIMEQVLEIINQN